MNVFPQRLTQLREDCELTKKQLAQILHVSDSCVSQYENGNSMPGYDTLLSISQYFGVSVDYLLGNAGTDKAFPLDREFCNNVNYHTFITRCSKLNHGERSALLTVLNAFLDK